jgi:hypothetical protein
MVGEQGIRERVRQAEDLDEGYQPGACDLPEWRLGKAFAPEDLPSSDCLAVGAESLREISNAAGCRSLPHGIDQDDNDAEIDFRAEETHRRRSCSLSVTIPIAAETEPEALWL